MWMVVGLGNPGDEYAGTRHNLGFLVLEHLRRTRDIGRFRRRYDGRWCEGTLAGRGVGLLMPLTFMNRSGDAVKAAASGKHVAPEQITVIHDDMDFPFGLVRARLGGGAGGHNGVRSIIERLGTDAFNRVRVGIGRPDNPHIDPSDWVLSKLRVSDDELAPVVATAADCAELILREGIEAAMNRYNQREGS